MKELWQKIISEAKEAAHNEPLIKRLINNTIDTDKGLWFALSSILSHKLCNAYISQGEAESLIHATLIENDEIQDQVLADLNAYYDRDFACKSYLEVLLFYRGFHAITSYRVARVLYLNGQSLTATLFRNLVFDVYGIDIHPNARLGKGIVVDHGIGLVIGETAEIGDNAFIFHNVTLGSTGHQGGDRHPKIKNNVFIGAGAIILGNIIINDNVNIGAGSVVTKDVPANTTVAGVPAKPAGEAKKLQ